MQAKSTLSFRCPLCALLAACLSATLPADAGAQEEAGEDGPRVRAARIAGTPPELDGRLDEAVWREALPIDGLRQIEPVEGDPGTEGTEIRVAYDDVNLYVGVLARDTEPERVLARTLVRDRLLRVSSDGQPRSLQDDAVAILLDPFHDHRNGVIFATNPNGAQFDALVTDEGRAVNADWTGVWTVAARRTPEGWVAEFAIPFRTLRYPAAPGEQRWGFNVYRTVRRKNEEALWSAWRRGEGFVRVSRAGHLEGLLDLPRVRRNLELRPYVAVGAVESRTQSAGAVPESRVDAGVDAKYEVRPGLTLDATLNPDFAQAEVDDQVVNLTRFSVFLPEKRGFFLENAGIFEFGVRGSDEPPPFLLFFSRAIGIAPEGEVPVLGGIRLSGRAGRHTVGMMNVVTDGAFGRPGANHAVLRVKQDVGGRNYLGAMLTDLRSTERSNTVAGVDGSVWPTRSLNLQGFAAATRTTGPGGEGVAYRLAADYQTGRVGISAQHLAIGPGVAAEMGFVTRTDIRRTGAFTRVTARPSALGLRRVDGFWDAQYITTTRGRLQDWSYGPGVSFLWGSGENLTLYHLQSFARLDQEFGLAPSVVVPAGDYRNWDVGVVAGTSRNRPVSATSSGSYSRFYDGSLLSLGGDVLFARSSHGSVSAGYRHNRVEVPGGRFDTNLASLRLSYAVSTRLAAQTLLQYNSLSRTVSANIRFSYAYQPGSDAFLVYNEQRGSANEPWGLSHRGAVAKTTYLIRP